MLIEKLKRLGLKGYESQAYLALVKLGEAEAERIAHGARIPMGRIYNVLSGLEEAGLIHAQDTRPRKYACVEPFLALERLFKKKQEELKNESAELEHLANNLSKKLTGLRPDKAANTFWTVAIGDRSQDLIRECVHGANEEILFFMASRTTSERIKNKIKMEKYSGIISAIYDSLKKGIDVKVILNKNVDFTVIEESSGIKKLMKYMGGRFKCRLAAIPATPFHIIDKENVLLQMLNPLDPEELFAVVNVRDIKLAEELRNRFYAIWDKADIYPAHHQFY